MCIERIERSKRSKEREKEREAKRKRERERERETNTCISQQRGIHHMHRSQAREVRRQRVLGVKYAGSKGKSRKYGRLSH